jgi:hypothetical protein
MSLCRHIGWEEIQLHSLTRGWVVSFTPWPPNHFTPQGENARNQLNGRMGCQRWSRCSGEENKSLSPASCGTPRSDWLTYPSSPNNVSNITNYEVPHTVPSVTWPLFGPNIILSLYSYSCLHYMIYSKHFLIHIRKRIKHKWYKHN